MMQLFACGLNAHGELNFNESGGDADQFQFKNIAAASDIDVLFAGFGHVVLRIDSELHSGGVFYAQQWDITQPKLIEVEDNARIKSLFGTHAGIRGGISAAGIVYRLEADDSQTTGLAPKLVPIVRPSQDTDPPKIGHVAIASNETTAVVFAPAPAAGTIHIALFGTPQEFEQWYADPSSPAHRPAAHFMVSGRPAQLVAGAVAFFLRTERGEVYSWGDKRYPRQLGRAIDDGAPAERPGVVGGALGGLNVLKIDSKGWLTVALTDGGDAFVWGDVKSPSLWNATLEEEQEMLRVVLPLQASTTDDDRSIADVALGKTHIVVLDSEGIIWSAGGENEYGELGVEQLPSREPNEPRTWVRIDAFESKTFSERGIKVRKVVCGDHNSFVLFDSVH